MTDGQEWPARLAPTTARQREQETFQRCPGDSTDQLNALIRASYKQVMGNPHLMEFERAISAESKFIDGYLSTREFVRALGLSAEYKRRFFETNAPYRFIELNFKHWMSTKQYFICI